MRGDLRSVRILTGFCLLLVLVSHLTSCETVAEFTEYVRSDLSSLSAPSLLDSDSVTVVVMPYSSAKAPVYYTARDSVQVHLYFDPAFVQLAKVKSYVLWRRDRQGAFWTRLKSVSVNDQPTRLDLQDDGAYGLRASVIYHDGREVQTPRTEEPALVWIHVDRSAPRLSWSFPHDGAILPRDTSLSLRWNAAETEFGDRDMYVDWSSDDGKTWFMIGKVRARVGLNSIDWKTPSSLYGTGLVRVTGKDLVGNESAAVTRVEFVPVEGWDVRHEVAGLLRSGTPPPAVESQPEQSSGGQTLSPSPGQARPPAGSGVVAANPRNDVGVLSDSGVGIRVVNISEGSVVSGGSSRHVFFEVDETLHRPTTSVRVESKFRASDPWQEVSVAVPAVDRKILVPFPEKSSSEYQLRLVAADDRGGKAVVTRKLSVDAEPPVASIRDFKRSPDGSLSVYLEFYDRGDAGVDEVFLFLSRDRGRSWKRMPVPNPFAPVVLPSDASTLGLWVSAVDKVGNESRVPTPGTQPMRFLDSSTKVSLKILGPTEKVLRGGDELMLHWEYNGVLPGDTRLRVEISPDGVTGWEYLGEVAIGTRRTLLLLPRREGKTFVVRLFSRLSGDTFLDSRTHRFAIDSSPPQLTVGPVPGIASSELRFPVVASDPGVAGLEKIQYLVRRPGEGEWKALPGDRVQTEGGHARVSLRDLAEGDWELLVIASDAVGNHSGLSAKPARFKVDKSAATLIVKPTAMPWIEGRPTAVQVEHDAVDSVPPLVLEGRGDEEDWKEVHRWTTLPAGQDIFHFTLPVAVSRYELRFSIHDRVGNRSEALVGPRSVAKSIQLESFSKGETYTIGQYYPVRWSIHPALQILEDELIVEVGHDRGGKDSWHTVYDGLPTDSSCLWTIPRSKEETHRLRLRLFYRGELVGQSVSERPFQIVERGEASKSETGANQGLSKNYSRRGQALLQNFKTMESEYRKFYDEVTSGLQRDTTGRLVPGQEALLSADTQRLLETRRRQRTELKKEVRENFAEALRIDPMNHEASYGHAQLLLISSDGSLEKAVEWLQRTVKSHPGHIDAINDLGAGFIRLGQYRKAAAVLEKALHADDRADLHYNYGLALFFVHDYARARSHFFRALNKGSASVKSGDVYYYLVASLIREGDKQQASELFVRSGSTIPLKLRGALESALKRM